MSLSSPADPGDNFPPFPGRVLKVVKEVRSRHNNLMTVARNGETSKTGSVRTTDRRRKVASLMTGRVEVGMEEGCRRRLRVSTDVDLCRTVPRSP